MGAINYRTSDYITLGIKPYDSDEDFEEIAFWYEDDFEEVSAILQKYDFWYYHVSIEHGYYEGFSVKISNNFPVAFDNWEDRRLANKEITEISRFLFECANFGLVACFPGWCTGYADYKDTIAAIKEAIKEMREEVKSTPTWRQYERNGA